MIHQSWPARFLLYFEKMVWTDNLCEVVIVNGYDCDGYDPLGRVDE